MNAIVRKLQPYLREFFFGMDDRGTMKRAYVENEYGWQLAIPTYSNNGDYGFHIISVVNVEQLGVLAYKNTGILRQMMAQLLPKIHIPGYLIEGRTRIFVIDKISGKFLNAKFNKWKNEAFLFFKVKGLYTKGMGDMQIKLRIAWILSNFFKKRAEKMREKVENSGRTLYNTWPQITELFETIATKLRDWVFKLVDPTNWNSKQRFEAKEKEAEMQEKEEERKKKAEELKKRKPGVIADLLGKLAWLTDYDKTIDAVWEIGKIEGVNVLAATQKIDRENSQQKMMCYG